VVIGDDAVIDSAPGDRRSFVTIYTHSPTARVTIGDGAHLYGARISCRYSIEIGREVLVEEAGISDTDFHSLYRDRRAPPDERLASCRVVIGDRVSIGARALVGKGVAIGSDAVVSPGAVVTRSLPPKSFAAGNPARVIEDPDTSGTPDSGLT
jgi:maltose O-acetyltransferase